MFYDLVSLEVYIGWAKGSSVYTKVGFIEEAYIFCQMTFDVTIGNGC